MRGSTGSTGPQGLRRRARRLAQAWGVAAALAAGSALGADDGKVLNVYNWSDYIGEETIRDFEKETGIHVRYDVYDANEVLNAKLRAGHTGYDIVMPSAHWAKRQIEEKLLLRLDKSRITTHGNLDPWLMGQLAVGSGDTGNNYLAPWLWGYTTVGINVDKVKAALGTLPMPENAWDLVFKPEYASRLRACGLSLLDTADDVFPVALHYLGLDGYSTRPADYEAAAELLAKLRPNVTLFSSSGYINSLAEGSLCAVVGYDGDILMASLRARAAKNGQKIVPLFPKSGTFMYFDAMAIPADAPHVENAYQWMSYIFRPEVQAAIVARTLHGNAVRASDKLVPPEVRSLPTLYLSPDEMRRLAPQRALPEEALKLRARYYAAFRAGQQ